MTSKERYNYYMQLFVTQKKPKVQYEKDLFGCDSSFDFNDNDNNN